MSELTHEKTATTVEIATVKAERTTSSPATTGRTPWDALVDIGGMLGRYTPWVIIVAGASYGVFKFTTLTQDAQKEANERLSATYKEIGEMHDQQMRNLSAMLKLNGDMGEAAEKQRSKLNDLQASTVKLQDEASSKIKAAEQAEAVRDKATKEAEIAREDKAQAEIELARKQQEYDDKTRQIAEREGQLADTQRKSARNDSVRDRRAERIMELKGKLIDLANRLNGSTDSSAASFGHKVLEEDSLEVATLLTAYGKEPGNQTAESLDDLVGSNQTILESVLPKGLGFSFWQKYSDKDGTNAAYIGVVRQTEDSDEGVVLISVKGKKVSDVDVFPQIVSVAGWEPEDWNKTVAYNLYLRPNGESGIDCFIPKTNQWRVPETETDFPGGAKDIQGQEKPLPFMSLDDFKKKEPEIFKAANASNQKGFSDMVAMLENQQSFDANKIAEPFAKEMPKGMSQTFVQLLSESVKRAPVKTVKLAADSKLPPEIYGPIAATALKTGFRIQAVKSTPGAKGETCSLVCAYSRFGEPVQNARLIFASENSSGHWTLLNFENELQSANP